MAHDVFISYSMKDKVIADAICAKLEESRIRCWIAARDMVAGENWAGGIVRALSASRVLVLVFSAHSNASPNVQQEVERATNKGLAIIPFRIEAIAPSDELAYFIGSRHWLDAVTPPMQKHLDTLVQQVKTYIALERFAGGGRSEAAGGSCADAAHGC